MAKQKWLVHRVVKLTFHGLPPDESTWQVHHRDSDRANNRLDNLEFVSNALNVQHSYTNPARQRGQSKSSKHVVWRPVGAEIWETCPSVTLAAAQLGISQSTASRCCIKESSAKGFELRFLKSEISNPTLPGEEWRNVRDPRTGAEVPGRWVSSLGRIMLRSGCVYQGSLTRAGYFQTKICSGKDISTQLVHRLVAAAFLGPPPTDERVLVNHKDGDKGNNAVENLEYVTPAENASHWFALVRSKCIIRRSNSSSKPVWCKTLGREDSWRCFPSMRFAAEVLGLPCNSISACARGLQRYEFRLASQPGKTLLPGEEWRPIDLSLLLQDREERRKASL
eukprot:Skav210824  [mRNA]  locus=scaffold1597:339900:340910:- [translate_table: standard]